MIIAEPNEIVSALLPCYTKTGDHSRLLFLTGDVREMRQSVPALLQRLAAQYAVNLTSLREQSRLATGKQEYVPLPLTPEMLFIPIKLRHPRIEGDNSLGYVNIYTINEILPSVAAPYRSEIGLVHGYRILSLWKSSTIEKQKRLAMLTTVDPNENCQDRRKRLLISTLIALWKTFPAV